MIFHLQTLKEKYLRNWDRQATVILLASALLLTLHRYYSRRSFFNRHFAEYLNYGPLSDSYPYYYWFLTTADYATACSRTRRQIWNSRAVEGLRVPTGKPENRMARDRRSVATNDSGRYPRCHRVSAFRSEVSAE